MNTLRTRNTEGQLVDVTLNGKQFFIDDEKMFISEVDCERGVVTIMSAAHTVRLTTVQLYTLIGIEEDDVLQRVAVWMHEDNAAAEMELLKAARNTITGNKYMDCTFPGHKGPITATQRLTYIESIENNNIYLMVPICSICYRKVEAAREQAEFAAKNRADESGVIHTPFISPTKPIIYPLGDE